MSVSQFYIAMVVGLVLSILVEEFVGIVCGGAIVSGYLSLVCDNIISLVIVFAVALFTFLIVEYILPKFMIIYGKRKFTACIICSLILKLSIDFLVPLFPFAVLSFRGIGIIVPGLIANTCAKQGVAITVPATIVSTFATFFIVQMLMMVI